MQYLDVTLLRSFNQFCISDSAQEVKEVKNGHRYLVSQGSIIMAGKCLGQLCSLEEYERRRMLEWRG